jgi:apolipoprotein N-acyltransferase
MPRSRPDSAADSADDAGDTTDSGDLYAPPLPGTSRMARLARLVFGCLAATVSGVLVSLTIHPSWLGRIIDNPPSFGVVAWIALLPMFAAVMTARSWWGIFLRGFCYGTATFGLTCIWIASVHPLGLAAAAPGYGIHIGVLLLLTRPALLAAPRWAWLTLPAAIIALDGWLANLGIRFPWIYLGYSQLDVNDALVQSADLFGVFGVSFLVMLPAGVLAQLITERARRRWSARKLGLAAAPPIGSRMIAQRYVGALIATIALVVGAHVYGVIRRATITAEPGPTVALMQPNVPLALGRDLAARPAIMARCLDLMQGLAGQDADTTGTVVIPSDRLSEAAVGYPFVRDQAWIQRETTGRIDLLVWPEAVYLYKWRAYLVRREQPGGRRWESVRTTNPVTRFAAMQGWMMLQNCVEYDELQPLLQVPEGEWHERIGRQNLTMLTAPGGEILSIYPKIELVPVGEYVPFGRYTDIFRDLTRQVAGLERPPDYRPGDRPVVFALPADRAERLALIDLVLDNPAQDPSMPYPWPPQPGEEAVYSFGAAICFETTFPRLTRAATQAGARSMIVQSTDAWFVPSEEPEQIWLGTRMRAIESRVGVARAVASGITGVVGPDGDFTAKLTADIDDDEWIYGFPGALVSELPQGSGESLYVLIGDVLPLACAIWIPLIAVIGAGIRRCRHDDDIDDAAEDADAGVSAD